MVGTKPCPDCAEDVNSAADVCRYCGHAFEGGRAWKTHRTRRLLAVAVVSALLALGVLVAMNQVWENESRKACERLHGPLADC
jgi:hypothetical protein